jgi:hypothetical protein
MGAVNKYLKTRLSELRHKDHDRSFGNMEISWSLQSEEATAAVETFKYLEEHKLIVCGEHGYALRNLDRHLVDYHVYPRSVRKTISRLYNGVAFVFPEDAPLPKAYGPPIEHIAPHTSGVLVRRKRVWVHKHQPDADGTALQRTRMEVIAR